MDKLEAYDLTLQELSTKITKLNKQFDDFTYEIWDNITDIIGDMEYTHKLTKDDVLQRLKFIASKLRK